MLYPDCKWVDVAYGGVSNRNKVMEVTLAHPPDGVADCYRTVYRYPEAFKAHFDAHGTVSGYAGAVYADFFPVDIDNADLETALQTARKALNELLHTYEVDLDVLRLFFSGKKGFHILIPARLFGAEPGLALPGVFKRMAGKMFTHVELDQTIYDRVRLFRISNTLHGVSGLYKVPLTAAELLHKTVEEIMALAAAPRKVGVRPPEGINESLAELYRSCLPEPEPARVVSTGVPTPPRHAKLCYHRIMEGLAEGNRDNAGLRLAVHWLKEYPADMVQGMMHAWGQRCQPPIPAKDVDRLVRQAQREYDFGCNDPLLKEYCSRDCYYHRQDGRVCAERIYTLDAAKNKYEEYLRRLEHRQIKLGLERIDRHIRGIAPGEVCQVMARTGVGKTALLLNVISHVIVNQQVPVLFFSLEQPLAQIYERMVQISNEVSGNSIEHGYSKPDRTGRPVGEHLHEITRGNYDKLYVVEEDFLSYEELRDFIRLAEEEVIGEKPPLVCIDYLGLMRGGRGNTYEVVSELARLLKALAKEMDLALLYLHQTARTGGTGAERISLDMGRDSGVLEEASDFILGMWRPDMHDAQTQQKEHEQLVISLLKNRKGSLGEATYKFKKPYLQIIDWDKEMPF